MKLPFGRNAEPLGLVAGFALWSLAFVVLYGGHGFACGVGVRPGHYDGVARAALGLVLLLFVAAHVWLAWWFWRRLERAGERTIRFLRLASLTLAIGALITTVWTLFPVVALTLCA